MDPQNSLFSEVRDRLASIDATLQTLLRREIAKEWYSIDDIANLLNKSNYTVREWCRNGRIRAAKQHSGRGKHLSWIVSQNELQRIQKEGLLPIHP